MDKKEKLPVKLLISGTIFIMTGCLLLLWTSASLTYTKLLWPLFLMLPGLGFLYRGLIRNGSEKHTIPGTFLTLAGIYFFLVNTVLPKNEIERIWPIFMLITGISMVPYGIGRKNRARIKILVPAGAIITMSLFFLPFSLRLLSVRFMNFTTRWWPVLLIILGFIFLTIFFTKLHIRGKREE